MTVRAAIVGPTGYSGATLIDLLLRHPSSQVTYLASRRDPPPNIVEEFPHLLGRLPDRVAACRSIDPEAIAREADVVFTCLPHTVAMQVVPSGSAKAFETYDHGGHAMANGVVMDPHLFVSIDPDGTVTIVTIRSEMGTGARTSLPMGSFCGRALAQLALGHNPDLPEPMTRRPGRFPLGRWRRALMPPGPKALPT